MAQSPLLELDRVRVVRNGRLVLQDVSLRIGLHESVAIIGPNGSGKSTLIKTISRECYPVQGPSGGRIRVFGETRWDVFELRKRLGIVTHDLQQLCDRDITGEEMVLSGFFSSVGVWPCSAVTRAMRRKVQEILERLDVSHLAQRSLLEVSLGESRRLLIGRALVHDPKALLLDEPMSSLDLRAMREFQQVLRRLEQGGTSLILVTHALPEILPEMKRVILIKDGTIFRDGPKEKILTSKTLTTLFGIPLEMRCWKGIYSAS